MRNIFLIGMSGCGKTTVGTILAEKLSMCFIDTDKFIVDRVGKTINEIFAENGEDYFRAVESEVLQELANTENTVVATGGGIIKLPQNRRALKSGRVVYIDTPPEVIAKRSSFSDRPLLKDNLDNIKTLHGQREKLYKECADIIVPGDDSPYTVAQRIKGLVL